MAALRLLSCFVCIGFEKAGNCSRVLVEIRRPFVSVSKETKSFSTLSNKRGNTIFLPGNVSSCVTPLQQWSFISDEFGPLCSWDKCQNCDKCAAVASVSGVSCKVNNALTWFPFQTNIWISTDCNLAA